MWSDLLNSRELAWRLLIRDLRAQYRQSLLGFAWAFLPPVITALGFVLARDTGVVTVGSTDLPYPAYVMFSMSLWQTFVEAINGPIMGVVQAKSMLAKVNFPREALILAKLGEIFFNFGIKLILIVGLFVWFKITVTGSLILAPVAFIHLVLLGTMIGLFFAPLGMLYGDISKALPIVTTIWLVLTPVIYPVPQKGVFATIVNLNPVTPLLVTTRELATSGVVSNAAGFWLASALAIVGLWVVWVIFRLAMPFVIERVGS
jgi:lipopolysaccharide transport system permease protein